MKFATVLALAGLAAASPAPLTSPSSPLDKRATFCGQWDSQTTGNYIVYNNLWGMSSGTGSQCTTVDSLSGNTLAWHTSWSWSGGQYNVKSYANTVVGFTKRALSSVSSIPSTWRWTYTGSGMVSNVAYDLFTSSSASGSAQYEIMIWLAAFGGAGPISSTGSPIATVTIAGVSWRLYKGMNGSMTVFSFVASSNVASFSGDLKSFVNYLTSSQGLPTSQILQSIGAGTEPFVGSNAVFKTSAYTCSVS